MLSPFFLFVLLFLLLLFFFHYEKVPIYHGLGSLVLQDNREFLEQSVCGSTNIKWPLFQRWLWWFDAYSHRELTDSLQCCRTYLGQLSWQFTFGRTTVTFSVDLMLWSEPEQSVSDYTESCKRDHITEDDCDPSMLVPHVGLALAPGTGCVGI